MAICRPYQTVILISVILFTSLLWTLPAWANKPLYLDNANTLSRTVYAGAGTTTINEGATASWVLTPALAQAITIDGSGASIPVRLTLGESGFGDVRDFTITLSTDDPSVGGNFAQLVLTGQDLNPAVTTTYNIPLLPAPSTANVDIASSYNITLSITNDSTGNGQRRVVVTPNGSYVDIPSLTVINVDSVTFYDNTYVGGGVVIPGTVPGGAAYVRAEISDPFGAYDITSATVAMTAGPCTIGLATMTEIVALTTASSKTYESSVVTTAVATPSTCTATVTGNEGSEGITDTNTANILIGNPNLTIVKSSSGGSKPGQTLTYNVVVTNTGNGYTNSVELGDVLSTYTAFGLTAVPPSTAPFTLSDSLPCGTASGITFGTPEYANDRPPTYAYVPGAAGWDGAITAWRMQPMTGSMNPGGCFTLQYQVQVK